MNWTPQQLLTFQTVAAHGTMTLAAKKLGYTTGAVSQQIMALEADIGRELFVRLPRRVLLTDVGKAFLEESRRILASYARAEAALEAVMPEQDVTLHLGVFTSVAVAFLPTVLKRLREEHPHITAHLHEINISEAPHALARGELDLTLSVRYPSIPMAVPTEVESRTLFSEHFTVVTGAQQSLNVEELNETGWILPPPDTFFGKAVRQALHTSGIQPKVRHIIENHVASVAMAEAGFGATVATATTIALSGTRVTTQRLSGAPHRDIVMLTPQSSSARPSVLRLEKIMQETIRDV